MSRHTAELTGLSAIDASRRLETGELDAAELFDAYRERAAADELNAFTWVADTPPPTVAGTPLGGIPLAVKDLFCTAGVPSQAGSRILEGYRPPYTATVVERLAAAGAPLLGKTNQDEFAMGSSNENSAFGPVLNPWDRSRVPGGSSGGSAAAVAAGLAPWALGTDTGGSIRQPAALCGIVGLKPTYGAVSRYGMIAFASSLDQAGPLARDVTDTALLFRHMVGDRDCCDSTSVAYPGRVELPSARRLDGIRLGVPAELAGDGIEPGVLAAFETTLALARGLGATVETCRLPHAPHALSAYYVIAPAECSSNLARFDGVRFGMRAPESTDLISMYTRTRHDGFGAEVKRRIMLGTYALSSGYYDAYYGRAQRVRTKISDDFRAVFDEFDFVVTPTSPTVAFELGAKTGDPLSMYLNDFCTVPMSLAGIPAISIPNGLARPPAGGDELPTGFQIAGPAFSESRILDAAHALEQELGFDSDQGPSVSGLAGAGSGTKVELEPVIGLEIHVQLLTETKMFCSCALSFGELPNTRTCPVCLGLPGSLPVVNERAIHFGLMIGLALGSQLAPRSIFHRKNYFYPDLPKGYQISQFDEPLCLGGELSGVQIHRVHLEEDAAKLTHAGSTGRIQGSSRSVVDFNRGGTPLAEIVTEPDIRTAEQASDWLKLLRATLRRLGVSNVNMDEGSLRCDANISLRPVGTTTLGTKTELKNMNSFRFIERGINAEIARQRALIVAGEKVIQETLHFDPATDRITSLRSKEEAHDYRYFPDPDLIPVAITPEMLEAADAAMPELPAARAERFERELGLTVDTAHQLAFRGELGDFFEAGLPHTGHAQQLAIWVTGELVRHLGDADPAASPVQPAGLAALVELIADRKVTQTAAKDVLGELVIKGGDPAAVIAALGVGAIDDSAQLAGIVAAVVDANPDAAAKIRSGNRKAIGAIIGQVMRETKGRADGSEITRLVLDQLGVAD